MRAQVRQPVIVALVAVVGALGLSSATGTDASSTGADERGGHVLLRDQAGEPVGVVKLTQERDGKALVRAVVHDLSAGFHGFHVHAVGECVPPFTSAGGHYDPAGTTHGDHAGDMPVLLVNDDGTGQLRFTTDRFSVQELFDADGSAIVVHAAPDNYANIPDRYHSHEEDVFGPDSATLGTGDAGGRAACGVIR